MKQWYSQLGQDKFISEKIFKNKKNGFFVDVGAHDGFFISNTFSLERDFEWSGVCIEPSESSREIFANRKCKLVSGYCVSEEEHSGNLVRFRQFMPNEFSQTLFEDLNEDSFFPKSLESGENFQDKLKKCKTLNEILIDASAPKDIDYISVDTQGCEWLVLKDFPFEKWNVKTFTVANDMFQGGKKEKRRGRIKALMEKNNYVLNRIFSLQHLDEKKWDEDFQDEVMEDLYIKQDN